VTPEYCARKNWLIGSPRTVAARLEEVYHEVGGFGTLLVFCFDYAETRRRGGIRCAPRRGGHAAPRKAHAEAGRSGQLI